MTTKELTDKIINSINNYQVELGRPLHLYEIRELIEGWLNENEKGVNK